MTGVREWTFSCFAVPLEDTGGKTTGRSGHGSFGPAHPRLGWPVAAVHATYGQGAGLSAPLTVRPPQRERPLTIVGPTCALFHILRAGTRERERGRAGRLGDGNAPDVHHPAERRADDDV